MNRVASAPDIDYQESGGERPMALTLETRRVSKGVRYPENKRTPLLTRRVTFLNGPLAG